MGIEDAGHEEYDPNAQNPLVMLVSCPVEGRPEGAPRLSGRLKITVVPGSFSYGIYEQPEIEEEFTCSYELNPAFQRRLESAGMRIVGVGETREARIVELDGMRFFVGTLFQPQLSSFKGSPHPLIAAYLKTVLAFRQGR